MAILHIMGLIGTNNTIMPSNLLDHCSTFQTTKLTNLQSLLIFANKKPSKTKKKKRKRKRILKNLRGLLAAKMMMTHSTETANIHTNHLLPPCKRSMEVSPHLHLIRAPRTAGIVLQVHLS
jgi:hypothetical protein